MNNNVSTIHTAATYYIVWYYANGKHTDKMYWQEFYSFANVMKDISCCDVTALYDTYSGYEIFKDNRETPLVRMRILK